MKTKKLSDDTYATVGTAAEVLGLSAADEAMIETKIRLVERFRQQRAKFQLTQTELAELIGVSQARVARMEAGDASVSVEALMAALHRMSYTAAEVGKVIGGTRVTMKTPGAIDARIRALSSSSREKNGKRSVKGASRGRSTVKNTKR